MQDDCKFGLQYQPIRRGDDPVLETHVANCPACQSQVAFV